MSDLTANELKVRGVSALEEALNGETEAIVSVRGQRRYVVMDMEQYTHLRECELEAALTQAREDRATGRFVRESAQAHVARLGANE